MSTEITELTDDINDRLLVTENQGEQLGLIRSRIKIQQRSPPREENRLDKFFEYIFFILFLLITMLVFFLITIYGTALWKKWYLPVLCSTSCAGLVGFALQEFTKFSPKKTLRAAFWLASVFTFGFGILLVYVATDPQSLVPSVLFIGFSVILPLYTCWGSSTRTRLDHADRILTVSTAYRPPKTRTAIIVVMAVSTLYSSFLIGGIAIRVPLVLVFLGSFIWTMLVVTNVILVTVSGIKYNQFVCGLESDFCTAVRSAAKYSLGRICVSTIIVPLLDGGSRKWLGFVRVGMYYERILQASTVTWESFRRAGMENLIDSDLTSSFCLFCAMVTGSVCGLIGGTWAILVQNSIISTYATQISLYTFLSGFFMGRMAMAWVKASVAACYVGYADYTESPLFDTTIPDLIQELQGP